MSAAENQRISTRATGVVGIAQDKARTALDFRRPSKSFQDVVAGGGVGLRVLSIRGVSALEGGVPVVVDGKIVGAIGVSGGTSAQDGVVAAAGIKALN